MLLPELSDGPHEILQAVRTSSDNYDKSERKILLSVICPVHTIRYPLASIHKN